jgi:membrane protein YdbS with pleckstrin-like domain
MRPRHRTKPCPFCAEEIRYEAVKCRFCGEFLRPRSAEDVTRSADADPEEDQDGAEEKESDVLWSGRPSLFALAWTTIKVSLFVALCEALYGYRVTTLLTYIPKLPIADERLALIERYIDRGAVALIAAAVLYWLWKAVVLVSVRYEVTPDRIEWSRGVFDRKVDNLDMFRVVDLKLRRSLSDCLFGLGTVQLTAKDDSTPHFDFVKVRGSRRLYDLLKEAALNADKNQNVVHVE